MSRHPPSALLAGGAAAFLQILFLTVLVAPAEAQRYAPRGPTTVIRPLPPAVTPNIPTPTLRPTLPQPSPLPRIETQPAPPAAIQRPAARVVRFRCDLAPGSDECSNPDSGDGDGDDDKCNCARDICRINRIGNRVCEKLR